MDVDPTTPKASSGLKRLADFSPASSSTEKPAKILPDEQLTTLSSHMNALAYRRRWEISVDNADDPLWPGILSDVLVDLTRELADTDLRNSVIAKLSLERADDIVKNFNKDQFEEWKVGLRNGVKSKNWIDLVARRTSTSDYQIIPSHLIATTAELKRWHDEPQSNKGSSL